MSVPMEGMDDLRVDWATYGGPYLRLPGYACGGTVGWQVAKLSFADPTPFKKKQAVANFIVEACRHYARAVEATAEKIYLDLYAKDGGRWECVETKDVWHEKARAALTAGQGNG